MGYYRGTLRSSGTKIVTSLYDKIYVEGPHGEAAIYLAREIKTGSTPTPGMGLTHDTAADGEDEWVTAADKTALCCAVAEYDPGQLTTGNTAAYTANDSIEGIFFPANYGAILQSVRCVDPATNINAMGHLTTSSGTAGKFKDVTEATLLQSFTNTYTWQTSTLGTNAAAGTFILSRVPLRQLYGLTDPGAAYNTVAVIFGE